MALKILWTPQAEKGLDKVISYLEEKWTSKEVFALEEKIQALLERIGKYPKIYPATSEYPNVRKGLVDKNNYIIYRIRPRKRPLKSLILRVLGKIILADIFCNRRTYLEYRSHLQNIE